PSGESVCLCHGGGSVAVVLRVRPPNPRERAAPSVLHVLNQRAVLFTSEEPGGTGTGPGPSPGPGRRRRSLEFEFDHVFGERATQEEVFEHTTLPLLDTLLAGYNCSVFAYGASGVGKTHTMMGTKRTPGIVHLATVELYKRLERIKPQPDLHVLLQVYKERVYDLLKPQGPLNVWEQPGKGVVAQGLSLHQPTTPEQLLALLAKGNKNRAQRSTKANAASSRSHAIFQIQVKHWDLTGGPSRGLRVAKLSFIDLAGSERAWDTPGRGEGMWEGTSINRSLLAFKSVVRALAGAKGGQSHVPFRDSKLTLLLKDSLVGSFRSTVIAAVSPAAPAGPDTYSTLRFASRARHITLPVSTGMAPRGGPDAKVIFEVSAQSWCSSADLVTLHQLHHCPLLLSFLFQVGFHGMGFLLASSLPIPALQLPEQILAALLLCLAQQSHVEPEARGARQALQDLKDGSSVPSMDVLCQHCQELPQEAKAHISLEDPAQSLPSKLQQKLVFLCPTFQAPAPIAVKFCSGAGQLDQLLEEKGTLSSFCFV
uniref:Kinesin-like protein n=1 Tax=Junco hyemalis TaxID=40217 RepID=A0A8C5NKR3_JUNHY